MFVNPNPRVPEIPILAKLGSVYIFLENYKVFVYI